MVQHQFVCGGQRSGKSRYAEATARRWQLVSADRQLMYVATALGMDAEMQGRIHRHRMDRGDAFHTIEEPYDLSTVIQAHSAPHRMLLIDCMTLWLTNWLMPADGQEQRADEWPAQKAAFLAALRHATGPVVMVSNEIGAGVIPLEPQVRRFIDELGRLNQDVAQACDTITWMVAGQPFTQKVQPW